MKIAIVGTGYVGLVTGISLSRLGHQVICVDNDQNKVAKINEGHAPFFEPGVDKLLKKVIKQKLFSVTAGLEQSVLKSEIIFICVGTPTVNNKIDLTFIKKSAEQIGKAMSKSKKYQVIVVKSTVLPGVTEDVVKPIIEKNSGKKAGEFGICMNPEFLREGSALDDALHPDRIVIGQFDAKSGKEFAKIYSKVNCPKIFTDTRTAELTKYASNALFATLISYANEISRISENIVNVDVVDVWKGVHLDRRLSPYVGKTQVKPGVLSYILSGCGFGGSCFPKDVKALSSFAEGVGLDASLIKSVIEINNTQPERIVMHLKKALGKNLKNKKIAILGLSFKPNTDDIRESAAFPIIQLLQSENAIVTSHDPMVKLTDNSFELSESIEKALQNADAAVIVTAWEEYKILTPNFFKKNMKKPVVIDGRRIYDKQNFLDAGIIYKGIGL